LRDRYGLSNFSNGQWMDKGQYISIFGYDLIFDAETSEETIGNGGPLYAAMVAALGDDENMTNNVLPTGVKLRYEYADDELKDLALLGVTVARDSVKRGPVISTAVTAAIYQSQLHSLPNIRMIQETIH